MSEGGPLIVGMAARTPVGLYAAAAAAAVRAGISRIAQHPYMVDKAGEPFMVAMDRTLDMHDRVARLVALTTSVIDEALEEVVLADDTVLPVLMALPERGPRFQESDEERVVAAVVAHLRERCTVQVTSFARGNAAGIFAMQQARELLRSRRSTMALVVGVDSHLDAQFLEQLDDAARLMSTTNRWGYPPGEGAGALLLSSGSFSKSMTNPTLARLVGVGIADEPNRIATDSVCLGVGLATAIREALDDDAGADQPVSAIYCDINGERYRGSEYVYALLRLGPRLPDPTIYTTAVDAWGDVGAATGVLLTVLALASGMRGYAKGPKALVWCGSENGLRGAAVLQLTLSEEKP